MTLSVTLQPIVSSALDALVANECLPVVQKPCHEQVRFIGYG
jgi:hypothetical protein